MNRIAWSIFVTVLVVRPPLTWAQPVVVFQSDFTNAADFTDLTVNGDVNFGTPWAKVFGRDAASAPLAEADRFDNDFFGTLADGEFLAMPPMDQQAVGATFSLGDFDNRSGIPAESVQMKWQITVPPQPGLNDRRLHIQFGKGILAGGPSPLGGGGVMAAPKPGRRGSFLEPLDVPQDKRTWGSFIRSSRFSANPDDLAAAKRAVRQAAAARYGLTGRDPRLDEYAALLDNTKVVDPVESFLVDLVNDNGQAFDMELSLVFVNDVFPNLVHFLNYIAVEIGQRNDFPEFYNDVTNDVFLGALPLSLDLNQPGNGANGMPVIEVGEGDIDTSNDIALTAVLDQSHVLHEPRLASDGIGNASVTFDESSSVLGWNIEWSNLTGPATAVHFRGPATAEDVAEITLDVSEIPGGLTSPVLGGAAVLTDIQAAELLEGLWYVDIRTEGNPDGEIRGQIIPEPATLLLVMLGALCVLALDGRQRKKVA